VISIDSLFRIYKTPQILLTIYGTAGQVGKSVFIAHKKAAVEAVITVEEESFLNLRPREQPFTANFFILGMLLMISFTAFLSNGYTRAFERVSNVVDLLQMDVREQSFLINKPLSRANLLFVFLLSLELAYLYLFVQDKEFNLFSTGEVFLKGQTLSDTFISYLKVAFICFAVLIGKYFSLYTLSLLYRLEKISNIHYFKIIQSSLLFFTVLVVVVSIASFYVLDWQQLIKNLIIWPTIVFYILRTILIFFTISSATNIKNLYLISYLCIVELIPLIVGIRYTL